MVEYLSHCGRMLSIAVLAVATIATPAAAREHMAAESAPASQAAAFSPEQLDNLFAPVALYPDPLLAQLLPASTFVDQVDAASRVVRSISDTTKIDKAIEKESWDVSVKSVAHYPQVLYMMADDLDWTTAVGQAYVTRSTDVMSSIQRLRVRARNSGALVTTPQQSVVVEGETIKIVPAQPQVIYVPQYSPQVVYVEDDDDDVSTGAAVTAAAISFGAGLALGAWLNNDCDWHNGTVYYHGWTGGGWVSSSRTYVNVNSVYVNRSYTNVNVNRTVVNRNVNYANINTYNRNVNYNNVNRTSANVNRQTTNAANRQVNNSVLQKNVNPNDARVDRYRTDQKGAAGPRQQPVTQPRATQPREQPATQSRARGDSPFGGYKERDEVQRDRTRGDASRQRMNQGGGGRTDAARGGSRPEGRQGGGRRGRN